MPIEITYLLFTLKVYKEINPVCQIKVLTSIKSEQNKDSIKGTHQAANDPIGRLFGHREKDFLFLQILFRIHRHG
jgi:hypothetical protein